MVLVEDKFLMEKDGRRELNDGVGMGIRNVIGIQTFYGALGWMSIKLIILPK
jgi:hypothetical protein